MHITTSVAQGNVPVTILQLEGELDASNYQLVIDRAWQAYAEGVRNLLLDLGGVSFMSSSGLVALHSVALLMRGERPPDPQTGWGALRTIDREREAGMQQQVKLLNAQPRVDRVLRMAGFDRFFEMYTDQEAAVASF